MTRARAAVKISEADFQSRIMGAAKMHGWRRAHFRRAMNRRGRWETPVAGDGAGFPDLVLVRGPRLIFAELKTDTGRTSPAQREWLAALGDTAAEVYVWRPRDWDTILNLLK